MIRYVFRSFAAHVREAPGLAALTVLGVALGVGSTLSVSLLNASAIGAFRAGLRSLGTDADVSVFARAGTLSSRVFPEVAGTGGVAAAWPVLEEDVATDEARPIFLHVVASDLLALPRSPASGPATDWAAVFSDPAWAAFSAAFARERHLKVGDAVAITQGSRRLKLRVGAIVDVEKLHPQSSSRLVVMDIAGAQTLFGRAGALSRIDVKAAAGVAPAALARRLEAAAGGALVARTAESRVSEAESLTRAFRLNLGAMSAISLGSGALLVLSSLYAALLRRRAEFGLLRILGASPGLTAALVVGESALFALAGIALGIPLGVLAARLNAASVSRTISNLYLLNEIEKIPVPAVAVVRAAAIGLGVALLASVPPAWDLFRRDARALLSAFTIHERAARFSGRLFAAALAVPAGAALWFAIVGRRWTGGGFVLAAAVLLSVALACPALLRVLGRCRATGLGWRFAFSSLGSRLATSSLAVAALAVAASMTIGVTFMIASFRSTVEVWIGRVLQADVYVTSPSWSRARGEAALDPSVVAGLASLPGVQQMDALTEIEARIDGREVPVSGVSTQLPHGSRRFVLLSGSEAEAERRMDAGELLIGEPLARAAHVRAGDAMMVDTPTGPVRLRVAGVYYDYGSTAGSALVSRRTMETVFGASAVGNVALYASPGVSPAALVDRVRAAFPKAALVVRSNRELRRQVMSIFDQTFAVTRLLQAASLGVAACAVALALLIFARERAAEWALLRALGAGRAQVALLFLRQGLGLAAVGGWLGLIGGVLLMAILVFVINRVTFGWTVQVKAPWGALVRQAASIAAAAIVASVPPALTAARLSAAELSREDV